MKKFLKVFLLSLVLVPCCIVFAACGESDPLKSAPTAQLQSRQEINTVGTYTDSSYEEFSAIETSTEINKYKITGSSEMNYNGETMTVDFNSIVDLSDPENPKLAMFYVAEGSGQKASMSVFVVDGYMYSELNGQKVKVKIDVGDYISTTPDGFMGISDLDGLLTMFESGDQKLVIKKASEGNQTKYEISQSSAFELSTSAINASIKNLKSYVIFNGNEIVGFSASLTMDASVQGQTMSIDCNSTLAEFNEEIQFPDLTSYVETEAIT